VETFSKELPTLYGDHHVSEVRRLLLGLPGIKHIYASSAFNMIEVDYDPASVNADLILQTLEKAGYLGELELPAESGAYNSDELRLPIEQRKVYFRQTESYAHAKDTVSFAQQVPFSGRPLWPCPGMGVIHNEREE
jgi:copper chaperone CopZ